MASTVTVSIVGRSYEVSCDAGQEEHVRHMAGEVDRRANELLRQVGAVGEARLLVMAALVMADEIADLRQAVRDAAGSDAGEDASFAEGLRALAGRVDAIARRLEST